MSPLTPLIAFAALVIERVTGYPRWLQACAGHPVQWIGRMIGALDARLNDPARTDPSRRLRGVLALGLVLAVVAAVTVPIAIACRLFFWGWVLEALLATTLLAQKSLKQHVEAVADGLDQGLAEGRRAVSMIVGRDPQELDASGVSRAAIESLAENSSDGVVAPALWLVLLGLPGIALYKAINTADSMIGHRSERYRAFGWAAARLDDLVNLPGSRLSGLLYGLAAWPATRNVLAIMRRDAGKHASPNAGWPEAAMAGALGLRLGGPRSYGGQVAELPWLGDGGETLDQQDIRRGLALYGRMLTLLALMVEALAVAGLLWMWL
ncbi:MAG: adenosylcobinamide-phosphate synthase CbiB [Parvibaculaceae bacterium]